MLVLAAVGVCVTPPQPLRDQLPPIYDVALDLNDTHHLYWRVDYPSEEVKFEVHSRARAPHPWIAVGFSDRGDLPGADLCVLWTDWHGRVHFQVSQIHLTLFRLIIWILPSSRVRGVLGPL